ncbi:MAG: 4-hydroxythreonine-4-phosphate dehydrogenase PdxA [Bacteroidetes bacterium]|nr:4-hydroxythreonine-4-phosphate dehydrogenase PdxA [Bacteroidota bacterium]
MSNKQKPVLGITIGEVNGIGMEVIIKTFSEPKMLDYCTPVIYGSTSAINYIKNIVGAKNFNVFVVNKIDLISPNKINLINLWEENINFTLGLPTPGTGKYALLSLKAAVEDAKNGKIDGIITAPIDKHNIQSAEFKFPGHTEFLADAFGAKALMILTGEHFNVAMVTGHIPISEVPKHIIKEKIIDKLIQYNTALEEDFFVNAPKIAVLALNPHAGENGLLGTEEKDFITPAIEEAKEKHGVLAFGPYPADGFWGTHMYHNFDGVLCMYHDQGLAPFKMMNFAKGVNFTAGLPIVRTSPDHGVGYGIATQNIADESSFREAVFTACKILRNRADYAEATANPLQSKRVKHRDREDAM